MALRLRFRATFGNFETQGLFNKKKGIAWCVCINLRGSRQPRNQRNKLPKSCFLGAQMKMQTEVEWSVLQWFSTDKQTDTTEKTLHWRPLWAQMTYPQEESAVTPISKKSRGVQLSFIKMTGCIIISGG